MITSFITGLAVGAFLAVSVGPVFFTVIKYSISSGFKAGMSFALGVSFSDTLYVVLGNLASGYIDLLEDYKRQIGVAGGLLLLGMGIYALLLRRISLASGDEGTPYLGKKDHVKMWVSGFLMNALNPAVILFWISTIAAITVKLPHTDARLVFYITCLGFVLSTDLLKVFLADKIRHKLTLNKVIWLNRISAIIIMLFGLFLIYRVLFDVGNLG